MALDGGASAGKHSQKPSDGMMTCPNCRDGRCEECVDRLLLLASKNPICTCKKSTHEEKMLGEPRLQQIQDPSTGDVYAPAVVISKDGHVRATGQTEA